MKRIKLFITISAICLMAVNPIISNASEDTGVTVEGTVESGEYTTIQISAEDDGNGTLLYAIDSDLPEAFQESNEFTVLRGSEHTVYVKDATGKISAQVYTVPIAEVDMEVNIGYSDTSSFSQLTDEEIEAIERGGGTVEEKVLTDNSDTAERLFYTITTKDEHVFYVVIDQSRSENNVYLLDQVTDQDLYALTGSSVDTGQSLSSAKEDIIDLTEQFTSNEIVETQKKESSVGDFFLYGILILLVAGVIYYYKIYKPKQTQKQELDDARELDEFESEEDQNDVVDFYVSNEEREAVLNEIINGSDFEDELMYDPELEEEKNEKDDEVYDEYDDDLDGPDEEEEDE